MLFRLRPASGGEGRGGRGVVARGPLHIHTLPRLPRRRGDKSRCSALRRKSWPPRSTMPVFLGHSMSRQEIGMSLAIAGNLLISVAF